MNFRKLAFVFILNASVLSISPSTFADEEANGDTSEVETKVIQKNNIDPIIFAVSINDIHDRIKDINPYRLNPEQSFDANMDNYLEAIKIYEEFKIVSLKVGEVIKNKIKNGQVLTGDDLYFIKRTISIYYLISNKILTYSKIYNNTSRFFRKKERQGTHNNSNLNKNQLLFVSANILVLDHFLELYDTYFGSGRFRRIIKDSFKDKESDITYNRNFEDLSDLLKNVIEITKSAQFKKKLVLFKEIEFELKEEFADEARILELIDSISGNKYINPIINGEIIIPNNRYNFIDGVIDFIDGTFELLSKAFGNLSGSVRFREGYLYKHEEAHAKVTSTLRPMDILLEKTPFALTDKFIPGHFGHVALYLGTKEQLMAIGMWDHPSLRPYLKDIENGKTILEAIRPGIHLTTVEEFMKIDEIAVLRKDDILNSPKDVFEGILRGMRQIGKEYDFNFDVETLDKIVCSELIYLVFGKVIWPTEYRFKRNSFTPDNVAEIQFFMNTKFSMITYFTAKKDRALHHLTKYDLAPNIGFETDGTDDQGNELFAKKSTRCYTEAAIDNEGYINKKRHCKVTKKRFVYEEGEYSSNY